jgi:thiopurine S-methyltransferase
MEKEFWITKWNEGQIGFHQSEPNEYLVNFFKEINLKGKTVFVPLCGKTFDMVWLKGQGAKVIGVELSDLAIKDFFSENKIPFATTEIENGTLYQSDEISIYCCDILNISSEIYTNIDYIFDRASLIALPEDIRKNYVSKMKDVMNNSSKYMLISLEYEGGGGPPFSITKKNVHNYFSDLQVSDISSHEKEVTFRDETRTSISHVFLITK